MAVYFKTKSPSELLAALQKAVKEGAIRTWSIDDVGDFTHATQQWRYKAWLRPRLKDQALHFYILPPAATNISKATYGVYHGRLIEAVLTHFDTLIESATASALAAGEDRVSGH